MKVMRGPTSEWRKRKALVSRKRCVDGTFEVFVSPLDEPDLHAWIASKDLETVIPPVGRPLRLLSLGDSITWGCNTDAMPAWQMVIQQ